MKLFYATTCSEQFFHLRKGAGAATMTEPVDSVFRHQGPPFPVMTAQCEKNCILPLRNVFWNPSGANAWICPLCRGRMKKVTCVTGRNREGLIITVFVSKVSNSEFS